MSEINVHASINDSDIAIIAMSCRFPGADMIEAFWQNLHDGVESISFFSDEELLASGIEPELLKSPNYVKAKGVLSDIEYFAASFFGFSPREVAQMDPQHRLFLEEAWKTLEVAGYDSEKYDGLIGVYAGIGINTYLLNNLSPHRKHLEATVGMFPLLVGNDKDYMPTRVSYKLNLKGPAVTIQTACSTSLVATHLACQSLLNGECDMALAGGVSLQIPMKAGYLYQEGMILSADGHCRAFDANAKGIVYGNGVGIVMIKRLADAIADGDYIHAVIKGTAINNDGSLKVAYTAPSVDGQAAVISESQAIANVDAETITYIEAHGTGTALGDPIEIAALTKAFRETTQKKGFCAIGSVKTNVGHLDTAAGVAGLIKTVLALEHKELPPSLNFEFPNPQIDFANSPFYVNTTLSEWKTDSLPRRAGVSSFGFGGTNAHVIVEEAPQRGPSEPSRSAQVLVLSAKTASALETTMINLTEHLRQHPDINLADLAFTLKVGRQVFEHRRMLVCQNAREAINWLTQDVPKHVFSHFQEPGERPVVFMFSGQGAQYVNMAGGLYEEERTFRASVDQCVQILKPLLRVDLRDILYPGKTYTEKATQQLQQTSITQSALFVIEYALAKLWMEWGICPQALIGHSIGEYVAACLAGVFSLEDALTLVAARGQLMQNLPAGAMLSVPLSEQELHPLLDRELSLAAVNTPSRCVVSGTIEAIDAFQRRLAEQGKQGIRLHTSHGFHSAMMDPIIEEFLEHVRKIPLYPPQIPWVSTVTGTWITAAEAIAPEYWTKNLRQTVRFAEGIQQLLADSAHILLEVGPGRTLRTLANWHPAKSSEQVTLTSLRHAQAQQADVAFLLTTLGKLWLEGVHIDWSGFYTHESRYRLPLPTYPFERQRYWFEPHETSQKEPEASEKKPDIADWFYLPSWKRSTQLTDQQPSETCLADNGSSWLVFSDSAGLGDHFVAQLLQKGQEVITVTTGSKFVKVSHTQFTLDPQNSEDYDALFQELLSSGPLPVRIVHLWSVLDAQGSQTILERLEQAQGLGFYSLLFLTQTLGRQEIPGKIYLLVVSNNMQEVIGGELHCPEKATLLGPIKVIPKEYPNILCRSIDVVLSGSPSVFSADHGQDVPVLKKIAAQLLAEFTPIHQEVHREAEWRSSIAYRGNYRWVQTFEPRRFEKCDDRIPRRLRDKGIYLITGGLGGIGLVIAEHLARTVQVRLILTGRSAFPAKPEWKTWLAAHDEHDRISHKIRKVQEIEELGAEVMIVSADVANRQQMQAVLAQTVEQFGKLHGVIHTAGLPGGGMMQRRSRAEAEQVMRPKVKGTIVLGDLFKNAELDFFLICSSVASIMGEFGEVDYCGADAFLDAFAHYLRTQGIVATAINWDPWQEVGMAVDTAAPTEIQGFRREILQSGILPEEGTELFDRILENPLPQIVTSTHDFQTRIKLDKDSLRAIEEAEITLLAKPIHARPDLKSEYAAPRNEMEDILATLWQEVLGIEQVGIYDDFFELGGDSLLGTQVISRIRETFQVELPVGKLFEGPTIAGIAEQIETSRTKEEKFQSAATSQGDEREEGEI